MQPITVTLWVDAAQAVRAGQSLAGPCPIKLSPEQLADLHPTERMVLAKHLGHESDEWSIADGPQWGDPLTQHAPPIGVANFDVLRGLLVNRAAVMAMAHERWCQRERARNSECDERLVALQREITSIVGDVPTAIAEVTARSIRTADVRLQLQCAPVNALAAAVVDPVIWAALANLRTMIADTPRELAPDHDIRK